MGSTEFEIGTLPQAATNGSSRQVPHSLSGLCDWWGSLQLDYNPTAGSEPTLDPISAWAIVESPANSFSFNTVAIHADAGTPSLKAAWWRPAGSDVLFAIQNIGTTAARIVPQISTGSSSVSGAAVVVPPNGKTTLFSITDLLGDTQATAGQISFLSRPGQEIIGRGLIVDASRGLSVPLAVRSADSLWPSNGSTPAAPFGLQTPSSGFPQGTAFYPVVVATSSASADEAIHLFAYSERGEEVDLGGFIVPARSGIVIDARELCPEGNCFAQGAQAVSLNVRSQSSTNLIVEVVTTDGSGKYSFYDPVSSADDRVRVLTGISWDLRGNHQAKLIFTNMEAISSDKIKTLIVADNDPGGIYVFDFERIEPHGSRVVDLRQLVESGTVDLNGRTLPPDSERGYSVMIAPSGVIVSNPTLDPLAGTCYTCPEIYDCFGYYPSEGWVGGGYRKVLCLEDSYPDAFIGAGNYEALFNSYTNDDCAYLVCEASGINPNCIGKEVTRKIYNINGAGTFCPYRVSGTAVSIYIPIVEVVFCYAVSMTVDENACR